MLLEARTALARLDGVGKHLPNPTLLMRPLQRREALRSSSLEGTYTEPEEQVLFDLEPTIPARETDRENPLREVFNYARALQLRGSGTDRLPLSRHLIRQLHHTLMDGVRGSDQNPGQFRTRQNQIGKPARFVPPPPHQLGDLLENFEHFLQQPRQRDPLVDAFLAHYQFETIHPFMDGNGRVGRLLLALCIEEWCQLSGQWLYMSAYFDRNKDTYMDLLLRVSTDGAWADWIGFCLRGVKEQADDAMRRCDRLLALQKDFAERLSAAAAMKMLALVDSLFIAPAVRVADAQRILNISFPTAQKYLNHLTALGILTKRAGVSPMSYISKPILDVTYED
ncbi:MAG: Fic family protein [Gemmatimonadaceae bacterium]|nr:Fic family protein [Gemmatimonadaceae bacterium]